MVYYKKHTDQPCIAYREALEEALCFGWIDSTLKKVDEERYLRKFTPRRKGSKWSQVNIRIAQALIREGKMTRAGLGKWENHEPLKELPGKEIPLPEFLREAFARNKPALENFQILRRVTGGSTSVDHSQNPGNRRKGSTSPLVF